MRRALRGRSKGSRSAEADETSAPPSDGEATPSRWVHAGTVCAIGLAATLLACTIIVVTGHRHQHGGTTSPTVPSPAAVAAPRRSATATVATDRTAPPRAAVNTVPADVTWRQVGLGALPFSASAGPRAVTAGVPSGFADTRPGAVLAATQILGRLSWAATSSAAMRAVADAMTTPSAQARAALSYGPPSDPALIPQLAGYQILTYSPNAALINLALRFHATVRVAPVALSWIDGDWRLTGAPGPLTSTNWAAIDDLTGYVLLSGQPTTTGH